MTVNRRIVRYNKVQSQILVWCGDEPLTLSYDSTPFLVPPINVIAQPGIGSPYRLPSATTKAGIPLAGTVVIQDGEDVEGTNRFRVRDFIDFLERDHATDFRRGLAIVTDPDDVKPVQEEGRPLYEESLDALASEILDSELLRQKKLEDAGRPVTQPVNEKQVIWAFKHKQKRGAAKPSVSKDDIMAAISGTYTAPATVTQDAKMLSASALIGQCEDLGITLNKGELMALLKNDEEQISLILEKIEMKKQQQTPA